MKNISKLAALALAVAGSAAFAGPTDLGTGAGTYDFGGTKDADFYVLLQPGTYTLTSDVEAAGSLGLNDVWFGNNTDRTPTAKDVLFTEVSPQDFTGAHTVTVTQPTAVFVDVDTMFGKKSGASFDGTLTVTAVPEPTSLALLVAGLAALGFMVRRRNRG